MKFTPFSQHVKHSEGNYRDELIAKILYMCSKEKFGLVTDFAWYASVLLDLAVMQGTYNALQYRTVLCGHEYASEL